MRCRRFGKTNLELSVFSLGTMRCLASEETAVQTVQRAIELGINHLETAQAYGNSEKYLGVALRRLSHRPLYLTTKITPTPDAATMAEAIDRSLARLGVEYVDCLAVHGVNTWEHLAWIEDSQGCMAAVRQAVKDGRIKHVGFSTHAPLEIILQTIATDQFEFVNLHYYFFNQRNQAAVAAAAAKDMGVFIISPADKGGLLYTPPQRLRDLCQPFTPLELTYRFLLSDPRITSLSVGPAQPSELDLPLQTNQDEALTSEETTALERLHTHLDQTLATDRCSQCYQCLPCPEGINIPEVLRLRNLAVAYDMTSFSQYRYRMFENAGHWFPGTKANRCTDCGDCLPRCPEDLAIPTLLRDAHERLNGSPKRRLWQ
jgi:predicted aldo/keto reductase-like oxidoreductase